MVPPGGSTVNAELCKLHSDLLRCKGIPRASTMMGPSKIKSLERGWLTKEWNNKWVNEPTCRQTKRFWPSIDWNASKEIRTLGRENLSKMLQIVTGHGFNKYHLGKEDGTVIMGCRFCKDNVRGYVAHSQ